MRSGSGCGGVATSSTRCGCSRESRPPPPGAPVELNCCTRGSSACESVTHTVPSFRLTVTRWGKEKLLHVPEVGGEEGTPGGQAKERGGVRVWYVVICCPQAGGGRTALTSSAVPCCALLSVVYMRR